MNRAEAAIIGTGFFVSGVAILCLTMATSGLSSQVSALDSRVSALESQSTASTQTASTCPQRAAACVTTPYSNGGLSGVGLLVKGAHGYGGTSFEGTDYLGAVETALKYGNWYVYAKTGWIGGDYCIVNMTHKVWRQRCLDWNALGKLGVPTTTGGAP